MCRNQSSDILDDRKKFRHWASGAWKGEGCKARDCFDWEPTEGCWVGWACETVARNGEQNITCLPWRTRSARGFPCKTSGTGQRLGNAFPGFYSAEKWVLVSHLGPGGRKHMVQECVLSSRATATRDCECVHTGLSTAKALKDASVAAKPYMVYLRNSKHRVGSVFCLEELLMSICWRFQWML